VSLILFQQTALIAAFSLIQTLQLLFEGTMRDDQKRRMYKAAILVGLCLIMPLIASCSSISVFMADAMPHWAGGLPANAPPRPSDPRYEEYERALQAKVEDPAKAGEPKAENGGKPPRTTP
jgi:hypothetical protein